MNNLYQQASADTNNSGRGRILSDKIQYADIDTCALRSSDDVIVKRDKLDESTNIAAD